VSFCLCGVFLCLCECVRVPGVGVWMSCACLGWPIIRILYVWVWVCGCFAHVVRLCLVDVLCMWLYVRALVYLHVLCPCAHDVWRVACLHVLCVSDACLVPMSILHVSQERQWCRQGTRRQGCVINRPSCLQQHPPTSVWALVAYSHNQLHRRHPLAYPLPSPAKIVHSKNIAFFFSKTVLQMCGRYELVG